MISHDKTRDFHDVMVAGLRILATYDQLTAPEFNKKMGNENAVNLLWVMLDNDLAYTDAELFSDNRKMEYKLTKKGKGLMIRALGGEINFNTYELLIR